MNIIAIIVGKILKNKYYMQIFLIGTISKFIQLVVIVLLGDEVVNHIWVLADIIGYVKFICL